MMNASKDINFLIEYLQEKLPKIYPDINGWEEHLEKIRQNDPPYEVWESIQLSTINVVSGVNEQDDLMRKIVIAEHTPWKPIEPAGSTIKTMAPRIAPKRPGDLENWVFVWNYIKRQKWLVYYGSNAGKYYELLEKEKKQGHYNGPLYTAETIKKILRAGAAGELETS